MKLAAIVLFAVLVPLSANADNVLHPPSGPVHVEARQPANANAKNRALRQALMAHFDEDGDGRLDPRERMRAVRVLERLQQKLAGGRKQKMRKLIQRFDTNRDGNVDRSEMPPGQARRLRRLDRDRDGWVEPGEVR